MVENIVQFAACTVVSTVDGTSVCKEDSETGLGAHIMVGISTIFHAMMPIFFWASIKRRGLNDGHKFDVLLYGGLGSYGI